MTKGDRVSEIQKLLTSPTAGFALGVLSVRRYQAEADSVSPNRQVGRGCGEDAHTQRKEPIRGESISPKPQRLGEMFTYDIPLIH